MTLNKRERAIAVVFLISGAIFALDQVALGPYLAQRKALLEQKDAKAQTLLEARQVVQREAALRRLIARMGSLVESDPSAAEGQFLHILHDWEQQAGVAKPAFSRVHSAEIEGYTHLTFQVSATGTMGAIGVLLYRIETAAIPLRVDDVQVTPKKETGEELQVQLRVSTLCKANVPGKPQRGAGLAMQVNGAGR